mgnify:CR=1 FL=1
MKKYWPDSEAKICSLPVNQKNLPIEILLPLRLVKVRLPEWAQHCSVDGSLLIPKEMVTAKDLLKERHIWEKIDWFTAAFLMLECWHERVWEDRYGSIQSYSFRLKNWDERVWERAWVNRIALFLFTFLVAITDPPVFLCNAIISFEQFFLTIKSSASNIKK